MTYEVMHIFIAKHVIGVHMNASEKSDGDSHQNTNEDAGELPLAVLKKYIAYCRQQCGPRLSEEAARKLCAYYVRMRNPNQQQSNGVSQNRKSAIPITVRQLEALVSDFLST